MKKSVDLLLILPVLLAIVLIVFASQTGALSDFFATRPLIPTDSEMQIVAPVIVASSSPVSTLTLVPIDSPAPRPVPSSTSTTANTQTATFTVTAAPTETGTGTATEAPTSEEIESGIATGNKIVEAMEHFYLDQGHYPAELNDLLPAYLPALPVTATGQTYFYRFFDTAHPMAAEGYWLTFRVIEQENLSCTYLRRLEYWDCNYVSP